MNPNLKDLLFQLIGSLPQKTSLNPKILETNDCGSYIRQKVEYSVEENERVQAYVLIPKERQNKLPAVFCHHQHDGNWVIGKSEVVGLIGNPDLAYAKELAERGYVTIAPDAIGFEERNKNQYSGIDILNSYQHVDELTSRIVKGQTLFAKALHDISVALDYLETREEVDSSKLGFIGHSYGGVMAAFTPAFEERIKVSVSNCGLLNLQKQTPSLELTVPGISTVCDTADIINLIQPRSLLLLATADDKHFKYAKEIYEKAKTNYNEGALEFEMYEGNHVFTKEMRDRAYSFLDHYLKQL